MIDQFEIKLEPQDETYLRGYIFRVHYRANGKWRRYNLPITSIQPEHWQSQLEYLFSGALHALVDIEKAMAHADTNQQKATHDIGSTTE